MIILSDTKCIRKIKSDKKCKIKLTSNMKCKKVILSLYKLNPLFPKSLYLETKNKD